MLTYGDMMTGYAAQRGLRRWLLPVPILTPRLSSYWVHLVTPMPAAIAGPLIEGLRNEVVVRDDRARELFPQIAPVGYLEAVRRALASFDSDSVETAWSDALTSSHLTSEPVVLTTQDGMVMERRQLIVNASPERVFEVFSSLGGATGWLRLNWAWQLRGFLDRLVGGVGMRRGRRHPHHVRVGDAVDFWRVEAVEPGRLVRLRAEMKVPGRAWLEFQARTAGGWPHPRRPDGLLLAARAVRAHLLVCALPDPRTDLRGHDSRDRPTRGASGVVPLSGRAGASAMRRDPDPRGARVAVSGRRRPNRCAVFAGCRHRRGCAGGRCAIVASSSSSAVGDRGFVR